MRFCWNVLRNLGVIGIAMTLGNKFSFKLDLYYMGHMHANTKNENVGTLIPKVPC